MAKGVDLPKYVLYRMELVIICYIVLYIKNNSYICMVLMNIIN